MPPGDHPRDDTAAEVERAAQAHFDIRPPIARVNFAHRADRKGCACIVDESRDRSERILHDRDRVRHCLGIYQICNASDRRRAVSLEQGVCLQAASGGGRDPVPGRDGGGGRA